MSKFPDVVRVARQSPTSLTTANSQYGYFKSHCLKQWLFIFKDQGQLVAD